MRTVLALLASSVVAVFGQQRAAPGTACWYPSHICAVGQGDGLLRQESLDLVAFDDVEKQTVECYNLCGLEAGCTDFTLISFSSRMSVCYLLSGCTVDSEAVCIEEDKCNSGPSDCTSVSDNADCAPIDAANTAAGNIHWQCTDGDGVIFNGYVAASIKAGSTCTLRCESWEALDGSDGYLTSECMADGNWDTTMANDGQAALEFPAKPDGGEYPTPADQQTFECGCKDLSVIWPLGDGVDPASQFPYNPSDEAGTDFVCNKPIDTSSGEYIIDTDNSCVLFCDSYLVADVRCLNGEWTGYPELGFWCYNEPQIENALTTPAP